MCGISAYKAQTGSNGAATFEWYKGAEKLAFAPKDAGSYTVNAILAASTTHEGTESAAKAFTIEKAPLTITGYTAGNKDYDDETDATVLAVTFSGMKNGEALALTTDFFG